MPWNKVYIYNVKQQEVFESKMQVLSSNGLDISLDSSVLYQPKIQELGLLHQTKGSNYLNVVIIPSLRAVARSVVGQYTPEQLYSTKRDAIQNEIFEQLVEDVETQHVQINSVLVRDVTLPANIKAAIERKLTQEQEALEYVFRLEKARQEAEKLRIDAEGKANANRILNSSLTDCVFEMKLSTNKDQINNLLKLASENELKNILGYEERPLVSTDFINDPRSSIIDSLSTMVVNDTQVKIYAWYDNEWGYANRLVDIVNMVVKAT